MYCLRHNKGDLTKNRYYIRLYFIYCKINYIIFPSYQTYDGPTPRAAVYNSKTIHSRRVTVTGAFFLPSPPLISKASSLRHGQQPASHRANTVTQPQRSSVE